jgi:hypothetical protein
LTPDLVSAALWLEGNAGRFNLVIGDSSSSVAFAVFGLQRTRLWGNWVPFYTQDPAQAQRFLDQHDVDYVVVDYRVSRYPPRYNHYFSGAEARSRQAQQEAGKLLPIDRLRKFDTMPALQRIYDNGEIVVFANRRSDSPAPEGNGTVDDMPNSGVPR